MPMLRLLRTACSEGFSLWMSTPSIRTLPVVGASTPAIICSKVDFPEPELPMTARNSPSPMVRFTPSRALTLVSPAL